MRYFLTISITLLLTLNLSAQPQDADAFFNGSYDRNYVVNNKIKEITVDLFIDKKLSTIYLLEFDKEGLLQKQTISDSSERKLSEHLFTYNSFRDQIERATVNHELNKTYKATFPKVYKGSQLISESSSELPYVTKYRYNLQGQKIEAVTTLGTDTINSARRSIHYTYGAAGRMESKKEIITNPDGTSYNADVTNFNYGPDGKLLSIVRENGATYLISYGNNGLLSSKVIEMPEEFRPLEMVDKYRYSFWQ